MLRVVGAAFAIAVVGANPAQAAARYCNIVLTPAISTEGTVQIDVHNKAGQPDVRSVGWGSSGPEGERAIWVKAEFRPDAQKLGPIEKIEVGVPLGLLPDGDRLAEVQVLIDGRPVWRAGYRTGARPEGRYYQAMSVAFRREDRAVNPEALDAFMTGKVLAVQIAVDGGDMKARREIVIPRHDALSAVYLESVASMSPMPANTIECSGPPVIVPATPGLN